MLRTGFHRKNIVAVVAALLILGGLLLTLRLTILTGDKPWFISVLKIDGPFYIKGMDSIAATGDFLNLDDIYHSPGYQIYIGLIDRLYPFDRGIFFGLKLLNGFLFLGTIVITVCLGERYVRPHAGWIAGAILALSLDWHVYANLLQGEVLQGFCFALFTWIVVRTSRTRSVASLIGASLLATFLTLLQVRYFPLVPLAVVALFLSSRGNGSGVRLNARAAALFMLPCIILLGGWSWHHSEREGQALFVGKGSEFRMRVAYNPNATGASYPYPEIAEPTGLRFVLSHPGKTAWLFRERALYLWNWKRDIWDLGNPISMHRSRRIVSSGFEIPFHAGGTLLFLLGVIVRLRAGPPDAADQPACADVWLYVWVGAVITAPLLVFASSRFLIPALPAIALFQACAVLAICRLVTFSLPSR